LFSFQRRLFHFLQDVHCQLHIFLKETLSFFYFLISLFLVSTSCLTFPPDFITNFMFFSLFQKTSSFSFYHFMCHFNFISSIFPRMFVKLSFSKFIFSRISVMFQSVWSFSHHVVFLPPPACPGTTCI
jgi:hypothetical protein